MVFALEIPVLVVLDKVIVGPNKDMVVLPERIAVAVLPRIFVAADKTRLAPPTEALELPDRVKAAVFKEVLDPPDKVIAADLPFNAVVADNDKVAPENKLKLEDADNPMLVAAVVIVVPDK